MWYVVCGRRARTGVRTQEPGFRSQNEEHLLSADCFLLTAYYGRRWQVGKNGWANSEL